MKTYLKLYKALRVHISNLFPKSLSTYEIHRQASMKRRQAAMVGYNEREKALRQDLEHKLASYGR